MPLCAERTDSKASMGLQFVWGKSVELLRRRLVLGIIVLVESLAKDCR